MRRLALALIGSALWLGLATSVFADGGPHIAAVNSGSLGLTSDNCAGCHRAHTAGGADLLKVDQSTLCLSCHNGNGSTVDVVDGFQYQPDVATPPNDPTHTNGNILGALRGGGFSYALMNSNNASRKNYLSQTQSLAFTSFAKGDTFTLTIVDGKGTATTGDDVNYLTGNILYGATTFKAAALAGDTTITVNSVAGFNAGETAVIGGTPYTIAANGVGTASTTDGSGTLTFTTGLAGAGSIGDVVINGAASINDYMKTTAAETQLALRALPAGVAKIVYTLNGYASSKTTVQTFSASWDKTNVKLNVSYGGYLAYVAIAQPLMTTAVTSGSGSIAVSQSASQIALRALPRVGVVAAAAKQPVTSSHLNGPDKVWGNGAISMGTGVALLGGDELECASCHNPHGSGTYRILRTDPGEDWISEHTTTFDNGVAVSVPDITKTVSGATLDPATTVRNYTVQPYTTAAEVLSAGYGPLAGDYVRRNVPAWYYSGSADFDTNGWAASTVPTPAANVTTWCISCHTRYNGISTNGSPSSLTSPAGFTGNTPNDPHFTFKHGTERVGCLMCHVSHGSSAEMVGADSRDYTNPDGASQLVYRLAATPGTFLRTDNVSFTAPLTGVAGTDYRIEGDSRLLKVDNRGTCQLCHDPTGTSSTDPTGNANISGYVPSPLYP